VKGTGRRHRLAILAAVLIVGLYYRWDARAATGRFVFGYDLDGFYDFLGQAFARGHLYLPIEPSPQLLALKDPYDPKVDNSIRRQDMVLYRGRYYLYFGAAPAVLLFAPWRLVTGHDLPENFAGFLLCLGGFLFAAGALMRVFALARARPPAWMLAALLLGLGFCQSVPFLLNRIFVYEIAIAGGYLCVSAGLYFLARGLPLDEARWQWLAASGLAFGAAVACRPHLVLVGAIAAGGVVIVAARGRRPRAAAAFLAAWIVVGALIALYNFERFGNPLEFGFRYQLAGPGQNRIELGVRNLLPGVYYMLLARPEFSSVFPWMRMVFRFPFDSAERHPLPPEYFVEPSVGALWLAPFLIAAFWIPSVKRLRRVAPDACAAETRAVLWIATAGGAAVLLFLMSTHLSTQRYEVDFLPLLVFAALASLGLRCSGQEVRMKHGQVRLPYRLGIAAVVGYAALANLALGVAGPYDDILRYRPAAYVRLAQHFSPAAQYRPLLNPPIAVELAARFIPEPAGFHEPLVTIGHSHYGCFLYAEHGIGTVKLIAQTEEGRAEWQFPFPKDRAVRIGLDYVPPSHRFRVTADGPEVLSVPASIVVTAPAQVEIGANHSDVGLTYPRFTGKLDTLRRSVGQH